MVGRRVSASAEYTAWGFFPVLSFDSEYRWLRSVKGEEQTRWRNFGLAPELREQAVYSASTTLNTEHEQLRLFLNGMMLDGIKHGWGERLRQFTRGESTRGASAFGVSLLPRFGEGSMCFQ